MTSADLIIVGAGGLGSEYAWVAGEMTAAVPLWRVVGFADDAEGTKETLAWGLPVLGTIEQAAARLIDKQIHFAVAVGKNAARENLALRAVAAGWRPATLIHPSAIVAKDAFIGDGSYVGPGCVVCPGARIGNHVIVNTHVSVGHHSVLGDYSQICPGARISGGCRIGRHAFLGSNASVNPCLTVGDAAVVGANSYAIGRVPAGATVIGCPAMPIGGKRRAVSASEIGTQEIIPRG